jgi:RimJ/RimL family protein N-acetyltransferase
VGETPPDSAEAPVLNIVGDLVALGPLRRELLPVYVRWRNDFYVQRTFGNIPWPVALESRTSWFESAATGSDAWFTIYERATLRVIGTTDLFEIDHRNRCCRFGMQIGEADARGKGYGTEVARLMLDFAFTALGLHSVMLDVSEYNLAGRRAYAKAGFREVGRRRQADLLNGKLYDLIMMDCLATEFESPLLGDIFVPDVPRAETAQ